MTIKTKLILSAALVALLSAPASARLLDDEGLNAYPQFGQERVQTPQINANARARAAHGHYVNRPRHHR